MILLKFILVLVTGLLSAIRISLAREKSIICSNIHFANKEFVQTCKNEKEYYNYIENCLVSKENCKLSKSQNLSRYYADVWWKQYPRKYHGYINRRI